MLSLGKMNMLFFYAGKLHLISSQISLACIVWGPVSHSLLSNGWAFASQQLAEPGNQSVKVISSNKWLPVHCLSVSSTSPQRPSLTLPLPFKKADANHQMHTAEQTSTLWFCFLNLCFLLMVIPLNGLFDKVENFYQAAPDLAKSNEMNMYYSVFNFWDPHDALFEILVQQQIQFAMVKDFDNCFFHFHQFKWNKAELFIYSLIKLVFIITLMVQNRKLSLEAIFNEWCMLIISMFSSLSEKAQTNCCLCQNK